MAMHSSYFYDPAEHSWKLFFYWRTCCVQYIVCSDHKEVRCIPFQKQECGRRNKEIVSWKVLRAIKGAASYLQGILFKVATGLGKRVDNAVSKQPPSSGNQPLVHCNYRAQPCHARLQRNERERETKRQRKRKRGGRGEREREFRLWDRELGKG